MSNLYLKVAQDRRKQTQCPSSVAPLQGIFFFAEMYIPRTLSADGFGGRTKNPNGDTEAKI